MKRFSLTLLLLLGIALIGCRDKTSVNAAEAYKLWAGEEPGKEAIAVHGKYWQSVHLTREYFVYPELAPTQNWINAFIKQNNLIKTNDALVLPTDTPTWFTVPRHVSLWKQASGSSLYMEDRQTGRSFIYEEQL